MMSTRFSRSLAFLFAFCGALWLVAPGVLAQSPPALNVQLSNGYARLSISGAVGAVCNVQYVTNLAQTNAWLPLTNLTLASNPQLCVDLDCPATGQRFYRVMTVANS